MGAKLTDNEQEAGMVHERLDRRLADIVAALSAGEHDAAWTLLDELTEQAPDEPSIYLARGDAYRDRGCLKAAADEFSYAAELNEAQPVAWLRLAEVERERGDLEAAADALEEAVALSDDDAVLLLQLGHAWLVAGDPGRAIGAFEEALEALADDPTPALAGRAAASLALDLSEDAAEDARKILSAQPEDEVALLLLARALAFGGDDGGALTAVEKVLGCNGNNAVALRLRGDLRWTAGSPRDAEADYRLAAEYAPDDVETLLALTECRLAIGDAAGAVDAARRAHRLTKGTDAEVVALLARAEAAAGRPTVAMATLTDALSTSDDPAPLYLERAMLQLQAGHQNLAWRDSRWAIEADPQYAPAYAMRGCIALDLEGPEEAVADLDLALELDESLGIAWAWRGRARELEGDLEAAIEDWAEAEALLADGDPLRAQVATWRRDAG